jgi:hypothetical protein
MSVVVVAMSVVVVAEEHGFYYTVSGECNSRNAETREGALEAVPPTEGAGVAPLFTADA